MRTRVMLLVVALSFPALAHGQSAQTFRGGVDLVTVDVAVLDNRGRPVEDLGPGDFTVKFDGQTRDVVSVELVKFEATAARPAATALPAAAAPVTSSNLNPARVRRVMIAVDQQYIAPGSITPLINAASRFMDRLTSSDQGAFTAFPAPGPNVEFTADKGRLRQAMQGVRVGQPQTQSAAGHDISLSEALAILEREQVFLGPKTAPENLPPTIRRVMDRSCRGFAIDAIRDRNPNAVDDRSGAESQAEEARAAAELDQCRRQVRDDAVRIVREARSDADISVRELEAILRHLATIDGPKSLLLVSGGLLMEDSRRLDDIMRLAAAARTSINVLAVERPDRDPVTVNAVPTDQAPTTTADRQLHLEGLREIAAVSRGAVFFVVGTGDGIFDRLAAEMSAYYVLAVEARPVDREPRRQRISVDIRRPGLTVRSSLPFVPGAPAPVTAAATATATAAATALPAVSAAATGARRPMEALVAEALASPTPIAGLPLQATTFVQRDAASGKARVNIVAQVGPAGGATEVGIGYQVTAGGNRVVASATRQEQRGAPDAALGYGTAVLLDPGTYSLRVGASDPEGRSGSVVQSLTVAPLPAGDSIATSDLILGAPPKPGEPLRPQVEPRIAGGPLVAYLELYGGETADLDWTDVTLEVARDERSPALVTEGADIADGPRPTWRVVTGLVPTETLSPGRYVLRARVVHVSTDDKPIATVVRPFVVEAR